MQILGKSCRREIRLRVKPYGMRKGNIMVIACKTPVLAQELLLRKTQFLVRFKPYAESLGLKVDDIVFDTKKWISEEEK